MLFFSSCVAWFHFIIYKSQTAVAKLMSSSSAGRKLTTTLLLYFPLDSRRTDVTPQKTACSGPFKSLLPQIVVAFVMRWESRPAEPPTVTRSEASGWSHCRNKQEFSTGSLNLNIVYWCDIVTYIVIDISLRSTHVNSFNCDYSRKWRW